MSRINEYKVKGGAFADPNEAISALDSLLEDVKATDAKSAYNTETERQYHTNIVGLQDCLSKILMDVKPSWQDLGLDGSFALLKEEANRDSYKQKAVFQHPVYEHVWLTNSDGKNMAEDFLPFLYLNVEYDKEASAVNLSYAKVETKLNLPELKTSLKAAREDLELVKEEVERAGSVVTTALDTVTQATQAIRDYCSANSLNFESTEGPADADADTSEKKMPKSLSAAAAVSTNDDEEPIEDDLSTDDDDLSLDIDDDDDDDEDLISALEESLDDE